MLTVDFSRFPLAPGDRVLDLGCGAGRHAFECYRRGAQVVALDQNGEEIREVAKWFAAMEEAGEAPAGASATAMEGDALNLPFPDDSFDVVIISEVMEHIPDDKGVLAEMVRVLRPGGRIAVTVPRYGPEKVCWTLSDAYHEVEGGHIRIYRGDELLGKMREAGLEPYGTHHAHGLHSPYWWLKCAFGVDNDKALPVQAYHKLLVWDIMKKPLATRLAERALNPVIGKSFVVYATKPHLPETAAAEPAATAESEPVEAATPARQSARSTKSGARTGAKKAAGAKPAAEPTSRTSTAKSSAKSAKNSTGAAK
ncbi:class I SAM-dependent methyltransferase [Streptomyces lydicus]|uniref:class I SAM-dependent methyltransferase n=1 Tax=Streptomyces lydicus TaxID=47763 RepID=UPI001011675E|nr:class I SAM-dependent methyltransferase [Streptomyces lydicus]MCZ1010246.1 methyltransferase domain-containing protein [Streptomyces lydicus]